MKRSSEIHSIQGVVFGALIGSSLSNFGASETFSPENKSVVVDMFFIFIVFVSCIAAHFSYHVSMGPKYSFSSILITLAGVMLPAVLIVIYVESSKYTLLSILERSTGVNGSSIFVIFLTTITWSLTSVFVGMFTNQNNQSNSSGNST
jgi:uncharacterized membrane protein